MSGTPMLPAASVVEFGRRRTRLCWPATAGLAIGLLLAGSARASPRRPRFTHLSVQDGLSQSSVEHILQDRLGFLWFGTQEGLNRYDGYRFTVHRASDQAGFLGDHSITALVEDRRGDLWVGTSRGLYRHDLATGRFDREVPAAAQLGVVDIVEDAAGRIFVATSDGGLWVLEPGASDRSGRRLESDDFAACNGITALARGGGATIWAAGDGALFEVEAAERGGRTRVTQVLHDLGRVSALVSDPGGGVWIGRQDRELLRFRPGAGGLRRFPQVPRDTLALLPASGGELWIGTRGGGLGRLDPGTGEIAFYRHDPEDPTSVSRDDVAALYEDHVGSLWIGTWNGGVNRLDPYAQAFRTLRHRPLVPDSLPADDVTTLTETPDGRLWLGSRSGSLAVGDPRSGRFRILAPSRNRGRLTAMGSSGCCVLVGTTGGLVALDLASGREVALEDPLRPSGLNARPIAAIRTTPADSWIASQQHVFEVTWDRRGHAAGVRRLEPPVTAALSALSNRSATRLWIGSQTGELVLAERDAPGAAVRFRPLAPRDPRGSADSLGAHGLITALHEDALGGVWVGTRRGLGRIDPSLGTIAWLGERDGLPSTTIAGIAGDADGFVWLGTNRGLTRIDPRGGAMTHFGEREGAQGTGYADGAWAVGASGLVYFAGEGVTAFDPREVRVSPHRPGIVFTGLEILRRPVPPRWQDPGSPLDRAIDSEDEVTLGPSATVFSVEMAALHYSDPQSNRVAYRLEGFDPGWIETDAQNRVATYTRLAPGRYVLHARARTKNGLWSEREATLAIRILPPWWRTRTALAGWSALALGAAGLAWAGVRRRARVRLALGERETLRRESLTDPLTGLYNRRFVTTYLQHEVPKSLREYEAAGPAASDSGADLLLILVDVDHFKAINDRYSHAAGDRVLASIASALKEHIRDSDLAVRWGGDEFFVVSRSFHRAHAAGSVERLGREVEALGLAMATEGDPSSTVSIGYAAFPFLVHEPKALTWEQTFDLADRALQFTKRRRRNSHTGLRASPHLTAAAVVEFLDAGSAAPVPEGLEIVTPEDPDA
jgi:diguanylate cyclase (GGDEF)-like protein